MPIAAMVQRIRSFSLSIGQLTFGGFLLVLAVIMITSVASVIAIRHIDSTFAELQRLQSVGDLAEDIDRRMNELRLAARDFVTDPGPQSMQVAEAVTALSEVLKKTRLELAPEQQDMIDGVTERLSTYRSCARNSTLPFPTVPTRSSPRACSKSRAGSQPLCWRITRQPRRLPRKT